LAANKISVVTNVYGNVFVPAGSYRLASPLDIDTNCLFNFRGEGSNKTYLYGDHAGTVISFGKHDNSNFNTQEISDFQIRGIPIGNTYQGTATGGLKLYRSQQGSMRDIKISFISGIGWEMVMCQDMYFENIFVQFCGIANDSATPYVAKTSNRDVLPDFGTNLPASYFYTDLANSGGQGSTTNSLVFNKCRWESNAYRAVVTYLTQHKVNFTNCKFHGIAYPAFSGFGKDYAQLHCIFDEQVSIHDCQFDAGGGGYFIMAQPYHNITITNNKFMVINGKNDIAWAITVGAAWMGDSSATIDNNLFLQPYDNYSQNASYIENGGDIRILDHVDSRGSNTHMGGMWKKNYQGTGTEGPFKIKWGNDDYGSIITFDLAKSVDHGTWIPEIEGLTTAGAPVYTLQRGEWFRSGSFVIFNGIIAFSSLGGAWGFLNIKLPPNTLPRTEVSEYSAIGDQVPILVNCNMTGLTDTGKTRNIVGWLYWDRNYIELRFDSASDASSVKLAASQITGGGVLRFSCVYVGRHVWPDRTPYLLPS
jgi:hypothetical protein